MPTTIGILALQGDYSAHAEALEQLECQVQFVKRALHLESISGLVLPGGESTAMLKLMETELRASLTEKIASGLPTLATCAGIILLASGVKNPSQDSLRLLDIDVERNSYGRQINSFIETKLLWTPEGHSLSPTLEFEPIEGVFIRAPRITRVGAEVKTLITCNSQPVCVHQDKILALTFHPEMSDSSVIHELFVNLFCN